MNHTTRASTKSFEYSISGANQNDDHALTYALCFSYPCHMQIQKKKKKKTHQRTRNYRSKKLNFEAFRRD